MKYYELLEHLLTTSWRKDPTLDTLNTADVIRAEYLVDTLHTLGLIDD